MFDLDKYRKIPDAPENKFPTPRQCYIAVEQHGEVDRWIEDYLETNPEYKEYIEMLVELRRLSKQDDYGEF